MAERIKRPRLVGNFIRQRREAAGLSQRALGLLFDPPVTTQFISNVERGVTPLPPTHLPTLVKALAVNETDILNLLEKEYATKLSGRLGKFTNETDGADPFVGILVAESDREFMKHIYEAYRNADDKSKLAFIAACSTVLHVTISPPGANRSTNPSNE